MFMCNLSVHIRPVDLARMINNNMKTPRDEILLLLHLLPLQAGSFYDGYNLENKDRGLTTLSGCTPADATPC